MEDPVPQFSYFIKQLKKKHPDFSFIHLVEPRVIGGNDREGGAPAGESNNVFRELWRPKPFISAGGFTRQLAIEYADKEGDLVAFGRYFISNVSELFLFGTKEAYQGNSSLISSSV
jgi:NADPH2 dehydrogenase